MTPRSRLPLRGVAGEPEAGSARSVEGFGLAVFCSSAQRAFVQDVLRFTTGAFSQRGHKIPEDAVLSCESVQTESTSMLIDVHVHQMFMNTGWLLMISPCLFAAAIVRNRNRNDSNNSNSNSHSNSLLL